LRDDLDVVRISGKRFVLIDCGANLFGDGAIGGIHFLRISGCGVFARVALVHLGVVGSGLRILMRCGNGDQRGP
jgi:hypothetical protein